MIDIRETDGVNCVIRRVNTVKVKLVRGPVGGNFERPSPIRTVMSGEEGEDSKPKLNLVISHSGTRTSSLVRYRR